LGRDSNRARAQREKQAGGLFRCPRACRRGAPGGRVSPLRPKRKSCRVGGRIFALYYSLFIIKSSLFTKTPRQDFLSE